MPESKPWVLVDLDGTLVNSSHRFHLAPQDSCEKEDWEAYEHLWYNDQPYDDVLMVLQALEGRCKIAIVTGRPYYRQEATMEWLMLWRVPYDEIYMREDVKEDPANTKGAVAKEKFIDAGRTVLFALEDDREVVNAYSWIGIPTFHVRSRG